MAELSDDVIERFVSSTNCSEETARFYLEMCNGDLNQAIQHYNETEPQENNPVQPPAPQEAPGGHRAPVVPGQADGLIRGIFRLFAGLLLLPINVVKTSFQVCKIILRHSLTTTANLLLPTAMQNRYLATNGNLDAGLEAADFVRSFRHQYGPQHPEFVELSWKDAAREAENQSKFLFAYIHSSEHEDTDDFCRHVLTSSDVISFLNQHFVCWGGSIDRSPSFILATNLGATTFPFVCLLSYTGYQVTMVTSIQGKITGINLMSILQQAVDEQGVVMVERRAARHQRELDRQIREDQDMEYQRALEADRERDRQNQEAAEAAAAEQEAIRQQKEEEELAKEQEAQRRIHKEENIRKRKLTKKTKLTEEPDAGPGVAQIRVRLPDGSTYNRRFLESAKVKEVYDFVDGLENLNSWDYTLVRSFPRLEFGLDTRSQSLREMGIDHSVMLLVQSHDD